MMNLRFPESEINHWANRYTERQREKNRRKEKDLIDLKPDLLRRGYLTKEELHKIARWKSSRRAALTLEGGYRQLHRKDHQNSIHDHRRPSNSSL